MPLGLALHARETPGPGGISEASTEMPRTLCDPTSSQPCDLYQGSPHISCLQDQTGEWVRSSPGGSASTSFAHYWRRRGVYPESYNILHVQNLESKESNLGFYCCVWFCFRAETSKMMWDFPTLLEAPLLAVQSARLFYFLILSASCRHCVTSQVRRKLVKIIIHLFIRIHTHTQTHKGC